jgi:signal transduction histidine kinase/ligand-binding sensor domain-containing protein
MHGRTALFAFVIAAMAPSTFALDPHRAPSQYVLMKWGANTLPGAGIQTLAQTPDGYLWIGAGSGLARFDGVRFVTLDERNTPGLGDGGVSRLITAPGGSIYVGTNTGTVLEYKDGAVSRVPVAEGSGAVRALLSARDGTLWVAAHGRSVSRFRNGRPSSLFAQLGPEVPFAMIEDARGSVWLGTWRDGLIEFDGKSFTRRPLLHDTVQALAADHTGALWIGTPHGLYRLGATLTRFTTRDGLSHDGVTAILEDRDGNLWVGTSGGGLNRFTNGRFTRLTTREGLSDDDVRCLFEDLEGNLWIGTADGLNCLSNGRFVTYGALEGLPDPNVPSVAAGAHGRIWIGTSQAGVALLKDGVVTPFRLPPGIGREAVIALYEDRAGGLWITVDNGRLFRLRDGVITEQTPHDMQSTSKVPVVFEDGPDTLVYVSQFGLARLRDRRLTFVHPEAPRFPYVHCLWREPGGALWFGTSRGLARVEGETYQVFHTRDGLPHERVRSMTGEPDGALWVATMGGLAHVKDGVIRKLTVESGLPENYLRLVLDDQLGHLWLASGARIFRLDKREIHEVLEGRRARVAPLVFDTSDGLRTTEALLSSNPGARAPDGRLWFATARGLSMVDPAQIRTDEAAPSTRIETVTVDGRTGAREEYPPGRGEVTIEYAALGFRAPGKVRFRYRMESFDSDWVDAETRRRAYYSNLPPGRYRFAVMASNRDGMWNGTPSTFDLTLRPPFHRTPLFYAICAAALMAAAALVYRMRVGQIRERFAAILAERTRIARELHDTLAQGLAGVGLQIDTAIDRLPEESTVGRARQHMQRARRMVHRSLAEVRRSIWVLRAQTSRDKDGFSRSLAESLEHLTADASVRSRLEVSGAPRVLSAEAERNLLRIAHEAVTNAVRHSGAGSLQVDLRFDADAVHLQVRDDGRGFEPDAVLGAMESEHFGLIGIVERAHALGGELRITSRPGAGTEITCRLPYDCRVETAEVDTIEGITL